MASKLPKRWDVDPRLLPAQAPYPQPVASVGQVPPAVRGLANVSHDGPFRLLSRRLEAYNEGVRTVIGELEDRPAGAVPDCCARRSGRARARPASTRSGPRSWTRRSAACVFGDELAKLAEEGDDPASRVGELLESAAERQADGRVRCRCSRTGCGPMPGAWSRRGRPRRAERLVDGDRPWARLASDLQPRGAARRLDRVGRWARCGAQRGGKGSPAAAAPGR